MREYKIPKRLQRIRSSRGGMKYRRHEATAEAGTWREPAHSRCSLRRKSPHLAHQRRADRRSARGSRRGYGGPRGSPRVARVRGLGKLETICPFGPRHHVTPLHHELISLVDGSYRTVITPQPPSDTWGSSASLAMYIPAVSSNHPAATNLPTMTRRPPSVTPA